ncbi:MAG: hypothetical protein RLZZ338_3936 [Cyanobacteriota bacterium]|jgi:Holliday junction DNA helicase RuvA
MITYLKGTVIDITKGNNHRVILILEVNLIGYEIQIPPRMMDHLPPISHSVQVFTHLLTREDQMVLYGFASSAERDLFRLLIGVSGIGAQIAIALLDTLGLENLVHAIVAGSTKVLAKTPGVGPKTAERLALELRSTLSQWLEVVGLSSSLLVGLTPDVHADIEMTLLALGYTASEVMQALKALSSDANRAKTASSEEWIRDAIAYLTES